MEETTYSGSFKLSSWQKMGPFMRPYAGSFVFVLLMMLLLALVDIAIPLFLQQAIDRFAAPGTLDGIVPFTAVYVAVILVQGVAVMLMGRRAMHLEIGIGKDLKRTCFVHLQKVGLSYYNQNAVGWILARVMSDTDRISGIVAWAFTDLIWSLFYVIGVLVTMFILNWQLALLVMIVVPLVALLTAFFQGRFLKAHREMRAANSRITGAWNEGITGAKTSKTLVIEEKNNGEFRDLTGTMYRASLRASRLSATFIPIIIFFSALALAVVLARGGHMVALSQLELGTLSAFIMYALSLLE